MISFATREKNIQIYKGEKMVCQIINKIRIICPSHIPKPQPLKVSIKGSLQQQLKRSKVKLFLFELLQQSKDHKDAMNQI